MKLPYPYVVTADGDLDSQGVQSNFETLSRDSGIQDFIGTGNPNGVVTASPGATFRNRAGGAATSLYVKESGVNTNTGWVGK
jgi:hypothetical protein